MYSIAIFRTRSFSVPLPEAPVVFSPASSAAASESGAGDVSNDPTSSSCTPVPPRLPMSSPRSKSHRAAGVCVANETAYMSTMCGCDTPRNTSNSRFTDPTVAATVAVGPLRGMDLTAKSAPESFACLHVGEHRDPVYIVRVESKQGHHTGETREAVSSTCKCSSETDRVENG